MRRRRHPNGRFWVVLTVVVLIVAAIVFVSHRRHPAAKLPAAPKPPQFALGHWTAAPVTLSQPTMGFAAVMTPHTIWLLGGLVNGQSTTLVQKLTWRGLSHLNPIEDITPGLPIAVHDEAAVSLPGKLVMMGGGTVVSSPSVFQLPLPSLGPATSLTPLPIPLSDLAAITYHGRILVIGGWDSTLPSNTIWSYQPGHPVTVWGHLPVGVRYAAVASTATTLYIVGGLSANGTSDQAVAYNLATKKITALRPYPVSVEHAEATVIDNHLVVAGGETNAGWIDAVYWYDAAKNAWKTGPTLPEPGGYGAFLTLPSGTGLWMGGDSPSGTMDVVWTIKATNKR